MALLEIENLGLSIANNPILRDVDLSLEPGEILGVVGESGSGKSLTALSVMQLLPHLSATSGSVRFDGAELLGASERAMCRLRGDDIGMVFQEPMTALNPVKTIGEQIAEGIRWHARVPAREALTRTAAIMERVGLPPSEFPLSRFPHELSGGQRQRVGIAIACAMHPRLLIADEPTTALDVTIQAQILDLLRGLVKETGMALILITHDLGVVADMADRIAVMRDGAVVEEGATHGVLARSRHAYTRQLAEASAHVPARSTPPVLTREA
ncbi:MAG: ABC transporter ATP-binding protein, partial [Nitratireductor sp.]|nr:ABC transporter ATP-binding protein [Nitratireductor sp.]